MHSQCLLAERCSCDVCEMGTVGASSSALYFRYEVKFQNGLDCGGGYIKLLTESSDLNLVSVRACMMLSGMFTLCEKHALEKMSSYSFAFSNTSGSQWTVLYRGLRNSVEINHFLSNYIAIISYTHIATLTEPIIFLSLFVTVGRV